ncbi:molybdopterin-binding protein [Paenibacillus sp. 1P07SE]|uniref:molybdopterin-binding protein n=1 Tax=Paenibacillus sp. 1P07SE TaxID=3132209 RepID=UPI0039A63BC7
MSRAKGGTRLTEVPVHEAVGLRLAHDLTQIIPGQFKGRLFTKGHLITEEDIPRLLDIGKEHIYIMELGETELHEDEAAQRLAAGLCVEADLEATDPHEGKVTIKAGRAGLLEIDGELVHEINRLGEIALATVAHRTVVQPGQKIAATRVIPLFVDRDKIARAEQLLAGYRDARGEAPLRIRPFRRMRVGLLTTGGEVFSGRIQDRFGPAVRDKVAAFGSEVIEQRFAPDDRHTIVKEILYLLDADYDMILVTGGMSVDPDDRTPAAIREAGAEIVSYGTPMLPGSMLLMGYLRGVPILGLPGCVMHDPYTSFDVLLPRILAGDVITREDIVTMGFGGMLGC